MKTIFLTKNQITRVSDQDYDRVNQFKWYASARSDGKFYAKRKQWFPKQKKYELISLHRFILNPPRELDIDHIDGDGLNNQRENLRAVDKHTNMWNQKTRRTSLTGFRGISIDRYTMNKTGRPVFRASVTWNGKFHHLGRFKELEDAISAREAKVKELERL